MAITDRYAIAGVQGSFSIDGTTSTSPAGSVSSTLKPDAGDAAWTLAGHIDNWQPNRNVGNTDIIRQPIPGRARGVAVLESQVDMEYTFDLHKINPLFLQLCFGTEDLTSSSSQFNPLEKFSLQCWWKFQAYKEDDTLLFTMDQYGYMTSNGAATFDSQGNHVMLPIKVIGLYSQYNTATPS
tara:strand:- start:969 stop:1514 length:546 start_codon:yes stop_codon:yes gene_type:complete